MYCPTPLGWQGGSRRVLLYWCFFTYWGVVSVDTVPTMKHFYTSDFVINFQEPIAYILVLIAFISIITMTGASKKGFLISILHFLTEYKLLLLVYLGLKN
ncbi:hypothetical protein H8356DRAFT_1341061 [Neocallimastix lanati (nom. inval.)]|nr:hypothetical protein H8356DRAFT_1341061 [Neocallimastix sp. JGI-2020a]